MFKPNLVRFLREIRSISLAKLAAFVFGAVVLLQMAVLVQYGSFQSPLVRPMPVFVGVAAGVLIAVLLHLLQIEARRTEVELSKKEALLQALSVSEARLSLATDQSHIWDWEIEPDELYVSPGFATALGYSAEELRSAMDGTVVNLLHPDDVHGYRARLQAHLENPSKRFLSEHRFRTKSNEYKWFFAFGQSQTDENGKIIRFAGTTTDVSERVHLEEQLYQAQKLEAIGKLTGGVAHDFNNLLAIIMGNLELLRDELSNPDQVRMIDAGLEATRRGAHLTQSMLTFAGKARLEPEVMSLNDVVSHAKNWMQRGLPETVDVELSLSVGLWQARLDTTMLESAILNLLLNAKDAMDARGKLTIETANVHIDEADVDSQNNGLVPGCYVMLAISDTGTGIPEDVLKNIFDPFYTTKGPGLGSGLGLSMVDGFVKQSGGTVLVHTTPGQGTSFKLYFPVITAQVQIPSESEVETADPSSGGLHVLLAEDEDEVLNVLVTTLKIAGYRVTAAVSGDEALEIYAAAPVFDLLVTDVVMPGTLQGPELAKAIRKISPDLPIIFMSGYAPEAKFHGDGLRPHDIFLMKPVARSALLKAITDAIGQQTMPKLSQD